MHDKLYLLDNLTFEQIVCAMLGINKPEDNINFMAHIMQLSKDAEMGILENAEKTLKVRPIPLMFSVGGDSLSSEAKKLQAKSEDKAYRENSHNWEFGLRSKVPRNNVIEYMSCKKIDVPSTILGAKVEASNLGRMLPENATPFMFICLDVFNRYWADTQGDD